MDTNISSLSSPFSTSVPCTGQTTPQTETYVAKRLDKKRCIQSIPSVILAIFVAYSKPNDALRLLISCRWFMDSAVKHKWFDGLVRRAMPHLYSSVVTELSKQPPSGRGSLLYHFFSRVYRPDPAPITLSKSETLLCQHSNVVQIKDSRVLYPCASKQTHLFPLDGSDPTILNIACGPDAYIAQLVDHRIAISNRVGGPLRIWSLDTLHRTDLTNEASHFAELRNGDIVWGTTEGSIHICTPKGVELVRSDGLRGSINRLIQLADSRILSVGSCYNAQYGRGYIVSITSLDGSDSIILPTVFEGVHGVTELKEGRIVIAYADGTIHIWSFDGLNQTIIKGSGGGVIFGLSTLADGRIIAQCLDSLRIISPDDPGGTPIILQAPNGSRIINFSQSTDGSIFAVCVDGRVTSWSLDGSRLYSSRCFDPIPSDCRPIYSLSDGRFVCKTDNSLTIRGKSVPELVKQAIG